LPQTPPTFEKVGQNFKGKLRFPSCERNLYGIYNNVLLRP